MAYVEVCRSMAVIKDRAKKAFEIPSQIRIIAIQGMTTAALGELPNQEAIRK